MDAESAHRFMLAGAAFGNRLGLLSFLYPRQSHPVQVMGLDFPNPVGLAAGFDKNGDYINLLAALGFGFIELGTVTPKSQLGNPAPRLFRLEDCQAIINRMGFNNRGVEVLVQNLKSVKHRPIIGINIGANKDSVGIKRTEDYVHCLNYVFGEADYIAVNISSPNTPGLRDLQQINELSPLLVTLRKEWLKLRDLRKKEPPLVIKIAPDLDDNDIQSLADLLLENGIHGVVATNTTIARPGVEGHRFSLESGGLSGKPLKARSLEVVRILKKCLGSAIPIIGCGGIFSADDASSYQDAGANCVQIYTGMIYRGPGLISECVRVWK